MMRPASKQRLSSSNSMAAQLVGWLFAISSSPPQVPSLFANQPPFPFASGSGRDGRHCTTALLVYPLMEGLFRLKIKVQSGKPSCKRYVCLVKARGSYVWQQQHPSAQSAHPTGQTNFQSCSQRSTSCSSPRQMARWTMLLETRSMEPWRS